MTAWEGFLNPHDPAWYPAQGRYLGSTWVLDCFGTHRIWYSTSTEVPLHYSLWEKRVWSHSFWCLSQLPEPINNEYRGAPALGHGGGLEGSVGVDHSAWGQLARGRQGVIQVEVARGGGQGQKWSGLGGHGGDLPVGKGYTEFRRAAPSLRRLGMAEGSRTRQ